MIATNAQRALHRMRALAALVLIACLCSSPGAEGAVSMYPGELYGGMNVVTVKASSGIRRLLWNDDGVWRIVRKGQETRNLRIVSAAMPGSCPRQINVYLFVGSVTRTAEIEMRIIECDGEERRMLLATGPRWDVDHQAMGEAQVGQTICQPFRVTSTGSGSVVVDRVVTPTGNFQLRFSDERPPVRIGAGRTYRYQVCFQAVRPGRYKMPIHVYIRRNQPNGGFNSFIVADTAYVVVVGPPPVRRPVVTLRPARRPPQVRTQPRRPMEPVPPPRQPDVLTVEPRAAARSTMPIDIPEPREVAMIASPSLPDAIVDPTTFRAVLLPTARSIGAGRSFLASYDVAGILAGYGVGDRLTVIGGGIVIPEFVGTRTADVTLGARYEFYRGDFTRIAGGVQLNHSDTDSSAISLVAPYVVASLGDDDRRASIAVSYSARRHDPVSGDPFGRQAIVIAAGADHRFGDSNWKVAAEGYWIQGSGYQPVIATVRYFGESFAVDAGAALDVNMSDGLGVAPVLSLVWVFGR